MNKRFANRIARIGIISLLIISAIYAYSFTLKNKTINEAVPPVTQKIHNKPIPLSTSSTPPAAVASQPQDKISTVSSSTFSLHPANAQPVQ